MYLGLRKFFLCLVFPNIWDAILDACEDAVVWLQFRESDVEEDWKKGLKEYLNVIIKIVEELELLVKDVHRLVSSISLKERKEIKERLKFIHIEEEETDKMQRNLVKEIFSSGKNFTHVYHLMHVIFILAKIADHAENVGDRIRVMMAR